jgi:hypothetical protein
VLQPSEFLSFGPSNPSTPKSREAEGSFRVISLYGLCTLQSGHKGHLLCHRILSGYQIFQTFTIPSPCTTRSVARALSLSHTHTHTHTYTHTYTHIHIHIHTHTHTYTHTHIHTHIHTHTHYLLSAFVFFFSFIIPNAFFTM